MQFRSRWKAIKYQRDPTTCKYTLHQVACNLNGLRMFFIDPQTS